MRTLQNTQRTVLTWLLLLTLLFGAAQARIAKIAKHSKSCDQAMAPGICRGRFLRYAYDKQTHSCVSFYYTGCASTENNFLTFEECRRDCVIQERY